MKTAVQIVFRRLTPADFYNINKPVGSEATGGGQTYIDFPISAVSAADWKKFFSGQKTLVQKGGPYWVFELHSLGIPDTQEVDLGQRRPQTFSIRRQTLGRTNSNRVLAWHPRNGFPRPKNAHDRSGVPNLVVYLIHTETGEYWAGWFQGAQPPSGWQVDKRLVSMFTALAGNLNLQPGVSFDENDRNWPFHTGAAATVGVATHGPAGRPTGSSPSTAGSAVAKPNGGTPKKPAPPYRQRTEEEVIGDLFAEDIPSDTTQEQRQILVTVLKRNQKITAALKQLYGGRCQLTGDRYTFKKRDGSLYCEAHHLLALGRGGADSPFNLIVVSPLIHRMFHYADVSGLDLKNIRDNKLDISISGEPFTITWHPKHAELVNAAANKN